ncbi:MAG: Uma2 family endonuclease [Prochloron sp. SP5CPC1]|nr:Uma2 family endonuclease [Candidatus Paraprochloron terpiosi SP5CPC1]
MTNFAIDLNSVIQLTDDQFYQLCRYNPDLKFERNVEGKIIVMSPTGGETGNRNVEIAADFVIWNRETQLGEVFDSSTGFKLPNGANRSPDVSWIERKRWDKLAPEQKRKFPPLAPDFVLELISPHDSLKQSQGKMEEYIINNVRLGWLIHPQKRLVEIYRLGKEVEVLQSPATLSGEDVLPGFVLNLASVWY